MPTLSTLADVVSSLATPGTVILERRDPATINSEGVAVLGDGLQTFILPTVIHPTSGHQRALLPEGVRTHRSIAIFSKERLRTVEDAGPAADVIIHKPLDGTESRFVVQTAENWGHVSGHWRVFATEEKH